jgi:HAD superfamily hydrolase (TIGR01490 family)
MTVKTLALFDFDGTLTTRDSLGDFIHYACGTPKTIIGAIMLTPVLTGYACRLIANDKAKEKVLGYFLGGQSLEEIRSVAQNYATNRIPQILRSKGLEKLQWHIAQGHKVVLVSASASLWLKPWSDSLGIELLSTELEVSNDLLTGRYASKNCHGEEKVRRINEYLNLDEFDQIYAYGDASGDKPMLGLAEYAFYKPFREEVS